MVNKVTPVSLGYPLSVFNKQSTLKGVARVNKVIPASLGYPLSVFNKNSTLKQTWERTVLSKTGEIAVLLAFDM